MAPESFDEIKTLLEDIKGMLLLVNQDKLDEMKRKLLKADSIEAQVYNLCEDTTTQEIATKIQKTPDYVNAVLSTLRRKGLVRTVTRGDEKVHEQRF